MVFLPSTVMVILADRISAPIYDMLVHLVVACRLLFLLRPLSLEEFSAAEDGLKGFRQDHYTLVSRGEETRLYFCRATIAALLDIAPNIRSCAPIWTQ